MQCAVLVVIAAVAGAACDAPAAYVHYVSATAVSDDVVVDHIWESIPTVVEKEGNAVFASMQFWLENGAGGYFGTQVWRKGTVDGLGRRVRANGTHRVTFSISDLPGSRVGWRGDNCGRFGGNRSGSHCVAPHQFTPGAAHSLRVRRDHHNSTGDWWVASVQDVRSQGPPIDFGSLFLPDAERSAGATTRRQGFGGLQTKATASLEYFEATSCEGQAFSSVGLLGPWWQQNTLAPTQAYPGYGAGACNRSDVSDCVYGAGCGLQRALFTAGGTTHRTNTNTSQQLWPVTFG